MIFSPSDAAGRDSCVFHALTSFKDDRFVGVRLKV